MGTVTLRWKVRALGVTAQRIYRSETPFDSDNLPAVFDEIDPTLEEYKDDTVIENQNYYYMISSYRDDPELEVFGPMLTVNTAFSLGPGPSTLIGGTASQGFFGEVPVTDLISGDRLASLVNITVGISSYSTMPWLKSVLDGKVMYTKMRSCRHSISWDQLNAAGLVYGKTVEIGGYQYLVRLLKGADTDPYTGSSGSDPVGSRNSEWTRIFAPISLTNFPSYTGPKLAAYTDTELGFDGTLNGRVSWCQEAYTTNRLYRGVPGAIYLGGDIPTKNTSTFGWRPCLVLLD